MVKKISFIRGIKLNKTSISVICSLFVIFIFSLILRDIFHFSYIKDIFKDLLDLTTIVILVFYVYYTYLIAKESSIPCASYIIEKLPNTNSHYLFFISNHSKMSIRCWCNLNLSIDGNLIDIKGFYGGKTPFDIQPFGQMRGNFDLDEFLKIGKYSAGIEDIFEERKRIKLDVEFWYSLMNDDNKIYRNINQKYYYSDFGRMLIADY